MNKFQQILNSFSIKKTLNPKIWENPEDPNKSTMVPKVRKALERIADEFIEYLGDEVFVDDVVLTGSLANFNWSEFSDFDLHIIVDLKQYEDDSELYKELFNLKKQVFTDENNKILTVEYRDYKLIENNFYPQKVIINTKNNEKELKINLNSKIRRINEKISFPFKIPNGYKKLQL
jgi:predicted nucleotidyltransferase